MSSCAKILIQILKSEVFPIILIYFDEMNSATPQQKTILS